VAWARAHRCRTGRWPRYTSGAVPGVPGETWCAVNHALAEGRRGLPGGDSLARLLSRRLGVRNHLEAPRLSQEQILAWADAHHARTGRWPKVKSGPVRGAPGETWSGLDNALRLGERGLRPGSSLARLLARCRGVRNKARAPRLSVGKVLRWADAHRRRTGRWPCQYSGPVAEAPGETWSAIQCALREGLRGFPGGDSLHQLLLRERREYQALKQLPRA
jgi:hypothetical protein